MTSRFSPSILALILLSTLAAQMAQAERPKPPALPPVVPGPHSRIVDDLSPATHVVPDHGFLTPLAPVVSKRTDPTTGGTDFTIADSPSLIESDVSIASNGDVYMAVRRDQSTASYLEVMVSYDGGTSFSVWGAIGQGDGNLQDSVRLHIAEGDVSRIYVQYRNWNYSTGRNTNNVAYSTLGLPAAVWNIREAFYDPAVTFDWGDLTSDAPAFSQFYLYATATARDGDASDIWFTRSIDFGDTWEAPYRIAELSGNNNLKYVDPKISYGFGGAVHVVWTYSENIQDTFDDAVRYRRATSYAGGGIASWDPGPVEITSIADGMNQHVLDIEASLTDGDVLIALVDEFNIRDISLRHSSDSGATWPAANVVDTGLDLNGDVHYRASTDEFIVAGASFHEFNPVSFYDRGFKVSSGASPLVFGSVEIMSDQSQSGIITMGANIALNAARGDQIGLAWNHFAPGFGMAFDGEWRGDPGYPEVEWELPLSYGGPEAPATAPAVVNVNDDAFLEIVFADQEGNVHVLDHEGNELAGWPQDVGDVPPRAAVAVGDLNGDGRVEIVVGDMIGNVHAFTRDGLTLPGFPVSTPDPEPARVAIGALGGPYPRSIVVTAGGYLKVYNYHGVETSHFWLFTSNLDAPAAIGDLDGDGVSEIVTLKGSFVHVHRLDSTGNIMFRNFFGEQFEEAPSLGDLDLDGDLEIVIPSTSGKVFVIHHDGSDMAGTWPFVDPSGTPATSVAIANYLGNAFPELAFANREAVMHAVFNDGFEQAFYPNFTTPGFDIVGGPIVERLNRSSPNLIVGTDGEEGWSYENGGGQPIDWPIDLGGACQVSPAAGDIDLDGDVEFVFVTTKSVVVVDANSAQHAPDSRWPMYGYDPERTHCLNCTENLATGIDEPAPNVSRLSFAPPSPNPSGGEVFFQFNIPSQAAVEMQVFDLRGRRVRLVHRQEQEAGQHTVAYDGMDQKGRPLAAGQYFARLSVRGPGINETMTRKFTVLR